MKTKENKEIKQFHYLTPYTDLERNSHHLPYNSKYVSIAENIHIPTRQIFVTENRDRRPVDHGLSA